MIDLTEQAYAAGIPSWCVYQTVEEHKQMLFCWALMHCLERGRAKSEASCQSCELYVPQKQTA